MLRAIAISFGHVCNFELRLLPNSSSEHDDSAHQRQPAEYRRNRHVLMFFGSRVDRPNIKNFFLMGIVETLVGKGKTAQNNKENSTPNQRSHGDRSGGYAVPLRP